MNTLNFDEFRRQEEEDENLVRCVRCGKRILATSTRCPKCGVHFEGEAQDFVHPDEKAKPRWGGWGLWIAVLLIAGMVLSSLLSR